LTTQVRPYNPHVVAYKTFRPVSWPEYSLIHSKHSEKDVLVISSKGNNKILKQEQKNVIKPLGIISTLIIGLTSIFYLIKNPVKAKNQVSTSNNIQNTSTTNKIKNFFQKLTDDIQPVSYYGDENLAPYSDIT